jgi:hypothetical protein
MRRWQGLPGKKPVERCRRASWLREAVSRYPRSTPHCDNQSGAAPGPAVIHDQTGYRFVARRPYSHSKRLERLSGEWRKELDRRIALLQKLRGQLDSCVGCGCLSLKVCHLRNAGDTLSDQGPGLMLLAKDLTEI